MSSTPPSEPAPEYLDADGGTAVGASSRPSGNGRRTAALGIGGVALLGLVGAGAWAATSLLATGEQPAEVLPAATLGYAAIDLDPHGSQKVAALRTLNRFPAFADLVDVGSGDDVVARIGETLLADAPCDVDVATDVSPWLGSRFAVAAVEAGQDQPSPVLVLQVSDADAAEDGLAALSACEDQDETGWALEGDWAVVAESDAIAEQVVSDAGEASLADDADFTRWTDEAGSAGILSAYAAPGAGPYLAEAVADEEGRDVPVGLLGSLEDFGGAAMTVRFDDGGLEVETASDASAGSLGFTGEGDQGAAALSALPSDTAAALGVGFDQGWVARLIEDLTAAYGDAADVGSGLAQLEQATGLQVPEDLETLLGTSSVLSVGGDLDLRSLTASGAGAGVPVALSVQGDPAEVERVLETVRTVAGPDAAALLASQSEGDTVAVGPDAAYRGDVLGSGGLGDSERFTEVVPDAEKAAVVLYLDLDAFDDLVAQLGAGAGTGPRTDAVGENVRVLSAVGMGAWVDGEVSHSRLVVTTDD